jgi:hypothetical protein
MKKLDVNYKLRLLKGLRLHLVFHMLFLEKAPDKIVVSNEELVPKEELDMYNVEKLLDSRTSKNGKVKYLVK